MDAARRSLVLVLVGAVLLCLGAPSQALGQSRGRGRLLTLDEAIAHALRQHPAIATSTEGQKAAAARVKVARSEYLPSLNASASYSRLTENCVQYPGLFPCAITTYLRPIGPILGFPDSLTRIPKPFDTTNFFQAGFSARQTIWDFGRTSTAVEAARIGVSTAADQLSSIRQNVILEVKLAFYGVLASQSLLKVAEETVAQQRKHLEFAKTFFNVGKRTEIDVAQSEADLATAEVALIRTRNVLEVAKLRLMSAIGEQTVDTRFTVQPSRIPDLPEELVAANPAAVAMDAVRDEVSAQASKRPEIRALDLQAKQQEVLARLARNNLLPILNFNIGPQWQGVDRIAGNLYITVTLTLPLNGINPWRTVAQMEEHRAMGRAVEAQASKLRTDVKVEVETARLTLIASKQAIVASERVLSAARKRYSIAEGRYQAGTSTIIELSDAQTAFTAASAARIRADYEIDVARARFARALGRE